MPVPVEDSSSQQLSRPAKRSSQRKAGGGTSRVVDVNSQLIEAISREKTSVVRRLLSSGADPNTCSSDKNPALLLACALPSSETRHILLELLLSKGARVDSENGDGQTALMRAAAAGDSQTCSILLEAGATAGKEDCDGNTALSYAAENGHEDTTRLIVMATKQQGCDVDHRNVRGLTALLMACQGGHLSAARVLVQDGGASPSIRDLDHFTTAAEWMQRSGLYLESDIKFLFPASRKKSYYRRQRQEKGIKTLSDYLLSDTDSPPNVFNVRESTKCERNSLSQSTRLSSSHSPNQPTSTPSKSMFDVPSLTVAPSFPAFRKKSVLPRLPEKPKISLVSPDFRSDLYHSRYLKQRQIYVVPNRQSGGFHTGALQPIAGGSLLEKIGRKSTQECVGRDSTTESQRKRSSDSKRGKHNSLPPLQ